LAKRSKSIWLNDHPILIELPSSGRSFMDKIKESQLQ
jgi:hypothetical protein